MERIMLCGCMKGLYGYDEYCIFVIVYQLVCVRNGIVLLPLVDFQQNSRGFHNLVRKNFGNVLSFGIIIIKGGIKLCVLL